MIRSLSPALKRSGPQTLMLCDAVQAYVTHCRLPAQQADLLRAFEDHLGAPAPLLAYTKITGETWLRSLPAPQQAAARERLDHFRAFLRDEGWLDAARPVNQFD